MRKAFIATIVLALASLGMAAGFSVGVGYFHQDANVTVGYDFAVTETVELGVNATYAPFSGNVDASVGASVLLATRDNTDFRIGARYITPIIVGGLDGLGFQVFSRHDAGVFFSFADVDGPGRMEVGVRTLGVEEGEIPVALYAGFALVF